MSPISATSNVTDVSADVCEFSPCLVTGNESADHRFLCAANDRQVNVSIIIPEKMIFSDTEKILLMSIYRRRTSPLFATYDSNNQFEFKIS